MMEKYGGVESYEFPYDAKNTVNESIRPYLTTPDYISWLPIDGNES